MRRTLEINDRESIREMLGASDIHLRRLKTALSVTISVRGEQFHIEGAEGAVEKAARTLLGMQRIAAKTGSVQSADVERLLSHSNAHEQSAHPRSNNSANGAPQHFHGEHATSGENSRERERLRRRSPRPHFEDSDDADAQSTPLAGRVRAMTAGQERYIEAIQKHDIVFAIGPAGSGKTYLAVAAAIEALSKNQVNRLILVRPAVEAGERLGFLPGDLADKVNPYLRPLYDALHDMLNPHQVARFSEKGVIEIAPLAFMRGRTLNNAFVILDEAQNSTPKQMKMFLTRLGRDAKAVITGDVTQVDLPDGDLSGLAHAARVLDGVPGVAFVRLEKQDIVRHPLVQRIVHAYEEDEEGNHS